MDLANNSEIIDLTFKSIIDALPCYIMIQDRDFNILFANQTFKTDFGKNILNRHCYDVLKGSHHQCGICPVRKTFRDKQVHIIEETIHLKDGTVIDMIAFSAPLFDAVGNVKACIKLLVNVGTIKDSHKELVTLGQSIALLSHDIKNILEGLQGGAYVVDEGMKDKDTKLILRGWDIVKKNITEISGIAQNILYSAKEREPTLKLTKPLDVARQAGQLFTEKASAMHVQLLMEPARRIRKNANTWSRSGLIFTTTITLCSKWKTVPREWTKRSGTICLLSSSLPREIPAQGWA
jgi:hypothetical protein